MDKETITILIQKYKQYETIFFNSTNLKKWASVIDIRDSYLYGEIGFCLAGLKPSVLFDFPVELNDQYINSVIQPWMKQYSHLFNEWRLIPCQLTSPEIESPTLVYFFFRFNDDRLLNTKLIELIHNNSDNHHHHHHNDNNNASSYELLHIATEDILANILDYPGHLPKSYKELETMREVIYYNDDDDIKRVLTTFACQLDEQNNVNQHFIQYKNKMASFGLKLKMIIRQPL